MFENRFFSLRYITKAIISIFIFLGIFSILVFSLLVFWGFYHPYKEYLSRTDYEKSSLLSKKSEPVSKNLLTAEQVPYRLKVPDIRTSLQATSFYTSPDHGTFIEEVRLQNEPVHVGKKIFVSQKRGTFVLSKEPTDFALVVQKISDGKLCCEVQMDLPKSYVLETTTYCFPIAIVVHNEPPSEPFYQIQTAKWLGQDQTNASSFQRLQIGDQIHYLLEGDRLVYKENNWQKALPEQNTSGFPVILCKSAEQNFLLYGWEPSVIGHYQQSYQLETISFSCDPDTVIQDAAYRSNGLVSCKMGGQRVLLQVGRWYIHKLNQWRMLSQVLALEEMNDGLSDDLFYCEKIFEQEGQFFFKGILFNSLRNAKKEVSVLLQTNKNFQRHKKIMQQINKNRE